MNIKITTNADKVAKLLENIKKSLKPEVIDKGLDVALAKDLAEFKQRMLTVLNKEIKSKVTVQSQTMDEQEVSLPKSDEELIKHLTGVDLTRVSKTKEFNSLADGKVAVVANKSIGKGTIDTLNGNPTSPMSSGVNLRIPMNPGDTFESQYNQALNYYNNAMFVFVDNNGSANYYMNPGRDISRFVKVVCSKEAGNTEKSNERWEKHRDKRDYADWTLLASGVSEIKRDFVSINDVIDKIKDGQYEEAKSILSKVSQRSTRTNELLEKIDNLKERKNLTPSVEAYNNSIKLIRNLKLEKTVKKDRTFYTLVSSYDETAEDYQNFQEKLIQDIKLWKITNEKKWISIIIQTILNLVRKNLG